MRLLSLILVVLLLACNSQKKSSEPVVIIPDRGDEIPPPKPAPPPEPPKPTGPPEGAVTAAYALDLPPLYSYIKKVHNNKGGMTIAFQENRLPPIEVPEGYGGTLSSVALMDFEQPLLLVNTHLKDPDFHKYYLFAWREGRWVKPVKPWAVHLDHGPEDLPPIRQERPGFIKRYYSVFDLDTEGDSTYTWRLLEEEVPVQAQ